MDTPAETKKGSPAPISHIRTYAGDVAALSGKPLPKNANTPAVREAPREVLPPSAVIPKAPTTNESKEAVLSRLRAKAIKAPPITSYVPIPKAVSTKESREEVLRRLGAVDKAPPAAKEEGAPGIPQVNKSLSKEASLHTYTSDFAKRSTKEGATRISMVAAQADAAAAPSVLPQKKPRSAFAFVAGGLLVVAGVGAVYAAYRFATGEPPLPSETAVASLVFVDERVRLQGSAEELRGALSSGEGVSLKDGGIAVAYLAYATTTKDGVVEVAASGAELIEALRLPAPSLLLRSIVPSSMVGFAHVEGELRPFFIFRVDSYERSFAGMLDWEATMERDLSLFFPPYPSEVPILPEGHSSTSPAVLAPFRLSFVDEVVGNRDVRVLRDGQGRIVMLYGYRDKETLIIARGYGTFLELLTRLAASRGQ
jgi:hypothetical protein